MHKPLAILLLLALLAGCGGPTASGSAPLADKSLPATLSAPAAASSVPVSSNPFPSEQSQAPEEEEARTLGTLTYTPGDRWDAYRLEETFHDYTNGFNLHTMFYITQLTAHYSAASDEALLAAWAPANATEDAENLVWLPSSLGGYPCQITTFGRPVNQGSEALVQYLEYYCIGVAAEGQLYEIGLYTPWGLSNYLPDFLEVLETIHFS